MRKTKRRFRRERQLKLLEQQKYKPKLFWNFIKGIGSTTQQLPTSVCTSNGEVVTEGNQVLNVWRDYFCSLLNPTNPEKATSPSLEPLKLDASILNESFSYEEVKAAVLSNHNNKSPGYDQIKPMFIKNEACICFLLSLFNYCFHHGVAPEAWFKTIIKPIPKSNLRSQSPADYRGISLQSFVAKTFSRLLNSRLREWLECNDALSDEQNGFRTDRCCQDHIFALTSTIENRMARKEDTFACFIDFKKAFDCVNRDLLWKKLAVRFGLSGKFLLALKALYKDVCCSVDVNHTLTDWFDVNNGVKQGCILSPTLFAMFIDDLVTELKVKQLGVNCQTCMLSCLLYADDIVLLAPSAKNLQGLINVVAEWCMKWNMHLNLEKTNVVHFRKNLRSKARSTFHFTFRGDEISYTSQYKYLGLVLNEHLNWSNSLENIVCKANRALALLNHRMRATGGFHLKTYTLLFNQLVQPIIMTNACIWGHKEYPKIANIQHRAMRFFLGVGKTCPIGGLFGEMGWIPLRGLIKFNILKFWHRIMSMRSTRLTRLILLWSKSLTGIPNWANRTSELLSSLYQDNLLHQGHSISDLWNAVMGQELYEWRSSINRIPKDSDTGGRLRFYRNLQTEPTPPPYIVSSISTNKRRTITMLRCGCLPLEVETGRYRSPKTPISSRTCQLCNDGSIGDEVHFLNSCRPLHKLRAKLFQAASETYDHKEAFYTLPHEQKTILLMQLCSVNPAIAKIIYDMFLVRKSLIHC